jgi:formylglycine-generating enzyme required for sulfatase activity
MKLTRIVHPVGQGGFYSEQLKEGKDEVLVFFDCGGNNRKSMEKYIRNYFPVKPKRRKSDRLIDAVFISHLHDDHVNGLEYLLKYFKVKYLFLPQLDDDLLLEMFLYNSINRRSYINNLILELYNNERYRETRIIKVRPSNNEEVLNEDNLHSYDLNIVTDTIRGSIRSGTRIHFNKEWLFIPYNPPAKTKRPEGFYEYFKNTLHIGDFDFKKLPDIVKEIGVQKCRSTYKNYFGDNHNAYSMVLFSGTESPNRYYGFSPNCLFMGDFETTHVNTLRLFFKPLWRTIRSLQVPHHGSHNNYTQDLYEFAIRGFIAVGEKNKYHHPSIDTLIGIKENDCEPIIVTESIHTIKIMQSNNRFFSHHIKSFDVNNVVFNMIHVEGGTFTMGDCLGLEEIYSPTAHQVTLSDYWIGETPVTQKLWKAVMKINPSFFNNQDCPVEGVTWEDCEEFIMRLNKITGLKFRLPTEAEWEFAARGGNRSKGFLFAGSNYIDDVAWYKENSHGKTHPVATKNPNELGLFDMSGNVWEWCQDWWYSNYQSMAEIDPKGPDVPTGLGRVIRGGSYDSSNSLGDCYVWNRLNYPISPSIPPHFLGLRLALEL